MRLNKTVLLAAAAGLSVPTLPALAREPSPLPATDWPRYARDEGGTRYSPLSQISRDNVSQLQPAWRFRLRPEGGAGLLGGTVPIVLDNVMYLPLGNAVVALEADTGAELWRHEVAAGMVRRAVSWWPGDDGHPPRLFYSTGSMIRALDPRTGQLDRSFGDNGAIAIEGAASAIGWRRNCARSSKAQRAWRRYLPSSICPATSLRPK